MKIHVGSNTRGFTSVHLLIVLALALCVLVAWQWKRETGLYEKNLSLQNQIQSLSQSTNDLSKYIQLVKSEIDRVEKTKQELNEVIRTNRSEALRLSRELGKATNELVRAEKTLQVWKDNGEKLKSIVDKQNESIRKQNESFAAMKNLATEKNELVVKYNELVKKYDSLMDDRNAVVKKMNEMIEAQAPAKK